MPLPTYKYNRRNYTVDYRLQQFRYVFADGYIDFIDFRSDFGDKILCKMIKDGVADLTRIHL